MKSGPEQRQFVSRAGAKLEHALRAFDVDVTGLACADFGCNVGGFTDCLLQHGAATVHAIDTGYGTLDWTLRNDPRVIVMERTNALHAPPPDPPEPPKVPEARVDLVTIDLGWTPQRLAIPAALRWLKPDGSIITLIKPHYEATEAEKHKHMTGGALPDGIAEGIADRVFDSFPALGAKPHALTKSPLRGGKSSKKSSKKPGRAGNVEFLAFLTPFPAP